MTVREIPGVGVLEFVENETRRAYYFRPKGSDKRTRCASVTTILGCLNKPALIRWAEDRGAEGAARLAAMGELDGTEPTEVGNLVRLHGLGADAARDQAAGRGLDLHACLEHYMLDGVPPAPQDFEPEHRGYVKGLARFLVAHDPEPIVAERIIVHPTETYAGRLDLKARINGRTVLVDVKTSRSGAIYETAHLQTRGYEAAEVACGEDPCDDILLVAISAHGEFRTEHCSATEDDWLSVVRCYRALASIRRGVSAQKRAEKQALKEAA